MLAVLAAGCAIENKAGMPWPEVNEQTPVDVGVTAPQWHKAASPAEEWSPGPEPDFASDTWRKWVTLKNASRALIRKTAAARIDEALKWPAVNGVFFDEFNMPAVPQTNIHFAYNEEWLYVAIKCVEPQKELLGKVIGLAPTKDHLLLELSGDADNPPSQKIVISVDTSGMIQKAVKGGVDISEKIEAYAKTSDGAWNVLVKVPLSMFGVQYQDKIERTLACRVARYRYNGEKAEVSFWTRLQEAGPVWGFLKFEGAQEKPEIKPAEK